MKWDSLFHIRFLFYCLNDNTSTVGREVPLHGYNNKENERGEYKK